MVMVIASCLHKLVIKGNGDEPVCQHKCGHHAIADAPLQVYRKQNALYIADHPLQLPATNLHDCIPQATAGVTLQISRLLLRQNL